VDSLFDRTINSDTEDKDVNKNGVKPQAKGSAVEENKGGPIKKGLKFAGKKRAVEIKP